MRSRADVAIPRIRKGPDVDSTLSEEGEQLDHGQALSHEFIISTS